MIFKKDITQDETLQAYADRQLHVFAGAVTHYPTGHAMFLMAAMQPFQGGKEIVLSGKVSDPVLQSMIAAVQQVHIPGASIIVHWEGEEGESLRSLLPHVADKKAIQGRATAYLCQHFACRKPIITLEALRESLSNLKFLSQ
ncbi:hypothetical protein [Paenibacillus sp. IHBB 10380]|uniref:hypothetical protein n=1 Tax=Paenibacillus sp. IHBB 10380 TaxID=1566358 RepID=UPI0005CFC9AF|nr:hypothetical protein [Paenibacillus sp. IHBB 10380]AJS58284.1 hypothetical protein UB51_06990 [Paenibacillus sp. IHBB 10380]